MKKIILFPALTLFLFASEVVIPSAASSQPCVSSIFSKEQAIQAIVERGNLTAARLLGQANIPLPLDRMSLHVALCQKMWEIGRKITKPVATATINPSSPSKPQRTEAELAKIREERQRNLEAFQREEEAKEAQRHAVIKANQELKRKRDAEFDKAPKATAAATQKSVVEAALERARQAELLAEERAQIRAQEREIKHLIAAKKREARSKIELSEQELRRSIQTAQNKFFNELYEDKLLAMGLKREIVSFEQRARTEKETIFRRVEKAYLQYREALVQFFETFNYRAFFVKISHLETEDSEPFHELKVRAQTFCQTHKIMTKRELFFCPTEFRNLLTERKNIPFLETLAQTFIYFKGIHFENPIQIFLFFDDDDNCLIKGTIPLPTMLHLWEKFLEKTYLQSLLSERAIELRSRNFNNTRLAQITGSLERYRKGFNDAFDVKKFKYNMVRSIFNADIDGLLNLLTERARTNNHEDVASLIDILATLIFKGQHDVEKTSLALAKFDEIHSRYSDFFHTYNVINPLMELLRARSITIDCINPRHPSPLLTWSKYELNFLPKDPERDKVLTINLDALSIYAWTKIIGSFNPLREIEKLMCYSFIISNLEPIHKRFEVGKKIFAQLSETERATKFVLDYERDWAELFSYNARWPVTKSLLPILNYDGLEDIMKAAARYWNVNMLVDALGSLQKRLDFKAKTATANLDRSFVQIVQEFPMDIFACFPYVEGRTQKIIPGWREFEADFKAARVHSK